jgi:hypothetical protein
VWGTGQWDWRGFRAGDYSSQRIAKARLPHDQNPRQGYIVNWNNKQAPGWHAADDNWAYGSVHRSQRLEVRVKRAIRGHRRIDLPRLVGIMGDAGTVDLRGQEAYPWMRAVIGRTRDPQAAPLLALLDAWARRGAHRADRNNDNVLEDSPAVALMDAWWGPVVRRIFQPRLGAPLVDAIKSQLDFDQPAGPGGSAYFSGWWGYLDKDLRAILGRRVRGRFSQRYCGNGSRRSCRAILLRTLKDAERTATHLYGVSRLADIRRQATCEDSQTPPGCDQIEFTTAGALDTPPIPWQDRGTFQQAVEIPRHRAR